MITEKDRQILTQVAYKATVDILARNGDFQQAMSGNVDERSAAHEWFNAEFDQQQSILMHAIRMIETVPVEQAMPALQAGFPGSVVEPVQQPYIAPPVPQAPQFYAPQQPAQFVPPTMQAPQQYQQPQQQPQQPYGGGGGGYGGGGGGSNADADWADLLANPSAWRDERYSKRNPNGPDFIHAFRKKANGKDVGLWLAGQFGRPPQHILQQLQQQGRA